MLEVHTIRYANSVKLIIFTNRYDTDAMDRLLVLF